MPRVFEVASFQAMSPEIIAYLTDSAQTFLLGAVVLIDTDGELIEAGADPALIRGVALQKAFSGPGNEVANQSQVVATTKGSGTDETSVAIANRDTLFMGRGVNGGTDPVIPLLTHIGEAYGLLKTAAGEWVIDFSETVNTRLRIVDIDIGQRIFFFKFLEANLQSP